MEKSKGIKVGNGSRGKKKSKNVEWQEIKVTDYSQ